MTISKAEEHSALQAIMNGHKNDVAKHVVEKLLAEGQVEVFDVIAGQIVDAAKIDEDVRKPRYEYRVTAAGHQSIASGGR